MTKESDNPPRGRGIYLLPNLFTITALFAGFYAIVSSMRGQFENAAIAIFVAMIMDSLDGRIARLTNTTTEFGAQLDSLSDMVSFGLAPALAVYSWSLHFLGKVGWLVAFIYAVAVCLRLARFNVQHAKISKRHFYGFPSPAGAGLIASVIWLGQVYVVSGFSVRLSVAVLTLITGLLMVSNVRYRSFKDIDLKGKVPFIFIVALVMTLVLISLNPPHVLFLIFAIYAVSGPVMSVVYLFRKKRRKK